MEAKGVELPAGADGIDVKAADRERVEYAIEALPSAQELSNAGAARWIEGKIDELKSMLAGLDAGQELSSKERGRLLWLEGLGNPKFKKWPYDADFIGKDGRDLWFQVRIASCPDGFCVCAVAGSFGHTYRRLSAKCWASPKEAGEALAKGAWTLRPQSGVAKKDADVIAAWTAGGTVEEVRRKLESDLEKPVRARSERESEAAYIGFLRNAYGPGRLTSASAAVGCDRRGRTEGGRRGR